jgi:hypothetical protein
VDLNPSSSTVTVDTTHVHSGGKALKLSVPVGGNRAFAVLNGPPVFPQPVNDHYGRMWVWISPMMGTSNSFTHIDNIEATGRLDGGAHPFERVRYGAGLQATDTYSTFYGNFTDDYTIDAPVGGNPPVRVPMQVWSCYEWHFGSPGMVGDFWFNGTRIPDLSPPGYQWNLSWQYPRISSVSVGWQAWGSLPVAMTVWVDDVAIGTSRLGCQ